MIGQPDEGDIVKRFGLACLAFLGLFGAINRTAEAASFVDLGNYMLDPGTNLDWLDPSATQALSYNNIINNVGVTYIARGWRFATVAELNQLFTNAGGGGIYPIRQNTFPVDAPNPTFDAAKVLSAFLGTTYELGTLSYAYGILADQVDATHHFVGAYYSEIGIGTRFSWLLNNQHNVDSYGSSYVGAFLVRDHVAVTPIPGALPLFISAMAGLGLLAGRGRRGATLS
jgi:hypothetical protein